MTSRDSTYSPQSPRSAEFEQPERGEQAERAEQAGPAVGSGGSEHETASPEPGAQAGAHAQQAGPEAPAGEFAGDERVVTVRMPVRRAPRFGRFIAAGIVVGLVVGVVIGLLPAQGGGEGTNTQLQYDPASVIAFWAAVMGLLGALVGTALALFLDKRS